MSHFEVQALLVKEKDLAIFKQFQVLPFGTESITESTESIRNGTALCSQDSSSLSEMSCFYPLTLNIVANRDPDTIPL